MRRLPAAVGALALAAAAVLAAVPAPPAPPGALAVATLLAGLAALVALAGAVGRREPPAFAAAGGDRAAPGDDVDALLAALSAGGREDPSPERRRLRERLESAAVATLTRRLDCSPAGARDRLAAGDWTDDPLAAAYFRDDPVSRTASLRALARGEPPTRRRARRAIDELHRLESGDGTDGDGPTGAADGSPSALVRRGGDR